jgi:hypothetical protein
MASRRATSLTLSINPVFYAILVSTPGGKFRSTLSIISFVIAEFAYASTKVFASFSLSVLLPPLCFILM